MFFIVDQMIGVYIISLVCVSVETSCNGCRLQ